jgi:hypothetical protein
MDSNVYFEIEPIDYNNKSKNEMHNNPSNEYLEIVRKATLIHNFNEI